MIVTSNSGRCAPMNSSQTSPILKPDRLQDLEPSPVAQRDSRSQTVMMSEIRKEIASSAVDQLDATHSLVEKQNKADGSPRGATSALAEEAADEQLDSYMKRFMERMTGPQAMEPPASVEVVQPFVSP